jgi:hypothetical protein
MKDIKKYLTIQSLLASVFVIALAGSAPGQKTEETKNPTKTPDAS